MDEKLLADLKIILKAFDDGVFVRNTDHDNESMWALKLVPILAALGRIQLAVERWA